MVQHSLRLPEDWSKSSAASDAAEKCEEALKDTSKAYLDVTVPVQAITSTELGPIQKFDGAIGDLRMWCNGAIEARKFITEARDALQALVEMVKLESTD